MPAKTPRMKPRKDGRMQKSLTIGRNPDGSYRRKTIYGKTQKEVNEKAAELMVQLRLGTYTDSDRTTFREVGEMWIANYKSAVSEGAHNRYDRIMRNHLFPELGAMRLKELKPFHLTSIINRCAAEGYASRTMAEIKHTASQILDAAVENDILFRNVFEKVKIPKVPANERRALTEEELSFITSTWQEHRMGLPVLIMAYCGLRRGEMLALTWSDIDMVKCEISVSKSVCMSGSKLEIKSPKSKAGTRIVPMPDVLIDAIKQVQKTSLYVWMFLSSFEKMRSTLIARKTITNLMHMENMVLGIAFGTAVSIFANYHISEYKGTYNQIKLCDIENEHPKSFPVEENRFAQVSTDNFSKIPGSPIAYWVSSQFSDLFVGAINIGEIADVRIGMGTGNNDLFLRQWWEIANNKIGFSIPNTVEADNSGKKYFPYGKGGECRRWYGNQDKIVWYDRSGRAEMKKASGHRENGGAERYFCESLTWSYNTSGAFNARLMPTGFVFDVNGSSIFPAEDNYNYVLGFLLSVVCRYILGITNATITTQAGNIRDLPIIINKKLIVNNLAEFCIAASKSDWDSFETSWDFKKHPLVELKESAGYGADMSKWQHTIKGAYHNWESLCEQRFNTLKANEEELNRIFIDIYGLQDELTPEVEDRDVTVRKADLGRDIRSLISYAVGCMFGRYSIYQDGLMYAGGEWDSEKFANAAWEANGKPEPIKFYSDTYFLPDEDNIIPICDDEYFNDDMTDRFVAFIETVYGDETLNENLRFIADALGGSGQPKDVIRSYFLNDFYADHCKIYQKRPIYWLFDSGKKNGFKALIYMHRYAPDTIARMRTDYVHEQQARYRTAIADLGHRIENASTAERVKLNKQLIKLQGQADEIRQYEEKIHHLADQMIPIDLDDGVKHNYEIFGDVLAKIK